MAFTDSHDLGRLGDGKVVFQNAVEYLYPRLFLLFPLYIPHRDDIFAEQLAGDRIVEHQQTFTESLVRTDKVSPDSCRSNSRVPS